MFIYIHIFSYLCVIGVILYVYMPTYCLVTLFHLIAILTSSTIQPSFNIYIFFIYIAVNCTKPLPIENGWMEGDNFQYNNQITYHCKQNYHLQGNKTLTCAANGTWTGAPPTCTGILC